MKKILPLVIALLLLFTACTQAVPNNSSNDSPSSTPSSSDSSNSTSNNSASVPNSFKGKMENGYFVELFAQEDFGLNNRIESDFEFNKEAFGSLKIEDVYVKGVNINDKETYYYKARYELVLKNALLGERPESGVLEKVFFTVVDSGNTDLPLGRVERNKTSDYGNKNFYGGYYNDTAFLEFIDDYHKDVTDIAAISSPLSCVGIALVNFFNHYGVIEFDSFSKDIELFSEIMESAPQELYDRYFFGVGMYENPFYESGSFDTLNKYVESVFGIENYVSVDSSQTVCFGNYKYDEIDRARKGWKYNAKYERYLKNKEFSIFSCEGLALSGFTRDGDNLYLDFTSYLDNLGFFINYRYRITLRLLPETDENGLRYVRIVSGEFIE